jgi:hypothetical protein
VSHKSVCWVAGARYSPDERRMSSIIRRGHTYHGISVFGRGVFTNDENGGIWTYAGQCKDGYACGLGVLTWSNGFKQYAEHGPDGQYDGRYLDRNAGGRTDYRQYERGEQKNWARVFPNGHYCEYNGEACAPDDPRLLALISQVAPVEVRPAAPAPHPPIAAHSPPSNRPMDRPARFAPAGAGERHCHRGAPPRRTPSLVVARHNPTAATLQSTTAVTRARTIVVSREAPTCTRTRATWCTPRARPGSFVAMLSSSTPPAERCHSRQAVCLGAHAARRDLPRPPSTEATSAAFSTCELRLEGGLLWGPQRRSRHPC